MVSKPIFLAVNYVSGRYLCYVNVFIFVGCEHNGPLGMITGSIQDWQITASSTYPSEWDKGCREKYARIYEKNGNGWCAKHKSASEWLQVDLGVPAKVGKYNSTNLLFILTTISKYVFYLSAVSNVFWFYYQCSLVVLKCEIISDPPHPLLSSRLSSSEP